MIGVESATAIAVGSLALKKLAVDHKLRMHAEFRAACESKGVRLV